MLNDYPRDQWISEQRQEFRTAIIDAWSYLFDQLDDAIATDGAILREPLCLSLQVLSMLRRGDACIDRYPLF